MDHFVPFRLADHAPSAHAYIHTYGHVLLKGMRHRVPIKCCWHFLPGALLHLLLRQLNRVYLQYCYFRCGVACDGG